MNVQGARVIDLEEYRRRREARREAPLTGPAVPGLALAPPKPVPVVWVPVWMWVPFWPMASIPGGLASEP
jgi:hypothetical protein